MYEDLLNEYQEFEKKLHTILKILIQNNQTSSKTLDGKCLELDGNEEIVLVKDELRYVDNFGWSYPIDMLSVDNMLKIIEQHQPE